MYLHAYSESLLTAYRHCPLLTIGHGHIPATYTWASWGRITGVASCQTALDMYLHTCFGELAQHLPALRPIDNRLQLVSVELARRLPALPPVDTRPQLCTCTHTRAGLFTAYRHLPPADNQPWMRRYTQASWRKLTSVASSRQAALDMYLYTCFGELAQPLPAFASY